MDQLRAALLALGFQQPRRGVGAELKVAGSMSQKSGSAPLRAIVPAVAKKVNVLVITASPAPISSAISANSNASVPEETPMPWRHWL